MKVVLERSPLAKEKLLQRAIRQTDSAKKNLDFEENLKSSVIPDRYVRPLASSSRSFNQDSRTRGGKKGAAVRSDSESELSVYEHRKEDEGSSAYSWIDSTRFLYFIFCVKSSSLLSMRKPTPLLGDSFQPRPSLDRTPRHRIGGSILTFAVSKI